MLPLVEAVDNAERHSAMLLASNSANAHVEHHVELLQAGEHRTVSIFPFSFWVGGVVGGSEGVVVCGQLVRSLNVVKMLTYRPCAKDVVRGIEVRTYLALCWPCLASDGCALAPWLAQRLPLVATKMKICSSVEIERPWCLDVRALCWKGKVTVLERRSSDMVLPV
jgi:hypothetical protein